MPDDTSVELQEVIDRLGTGDVGARRELLERAVERLRRLAAKILGESFPATRARHDLDSVVNETWMRLAQALDQTEPPTVQDFFRLAAHKIRQVLLDMVAENRRVAIPVEFGRAGDDSAAGFDPSQNTYNPARLSAWTEFHERVATLNDDERKVFEMHYYLELPQSQIASLIGLPPKQVSRLWITATDRLTAGLEMSGGIV